MSNLHDTKVNVSTIKRVKDHKLRRNHEETNPCMKEHNLSLKCLDDNNYVHDACELYFENYRNCQDFWQKVVADRKRKNVTPYLPIPEDRENVKNEYIKLGFK
ncbi:PREDICTED: coiled-coil-helix-coiled-coil-helix domain-containing protein 7 [Polistes dominula]|uniref:Coiled-coil-helix-coiled-coil-helix domain-containing protein 7 n=1 Tax=Polistes dominula TaxID=743375 RepID=A0ABM1JFA9_POLDO|nr:PREDICTED: coiled-coil-helix-coiled-coil-helix domain-containing protein 7 [Polistes dominula]